MLEVGRRRLSKRHRRTRPRDEAEPLDQKGVIRARMNTLAELPKVSRTSSCLLCQSAARAAEIHQTNTFSACDSGPCNMTRSPKPKARDCG